MILGLMRSATQWLALLLGLSAAAAGAAHARPFQVGDVEGVANLELSYGLLARIEGRNPELVAIVNGGSAESASSDDGDLNYDTRDRLEHDPGQRPTTCKGACGA